MFRKLAMVCGLFVATHSMAGETHLPAKSFEDFAGQAAPATGFERGEILRMLKQAKFRPDILESIHRPAEAMPWAVYEAKVVTRSKIESGKKFMARYGKELAAAERRFSVPKEVIAAIIGVESGFGANKGKIPVIDSLTTLGFNFPRRASFFQSELIEFLRLAKQNGMDPTAVLGSYAGAMGWPQFMPSSAKRLAIDFDEDGKVDLINSPADAIGSVANYLSKAGWAYGEPVVVEFADGRGGDFTLVSADGQATAVKMHRNFKAVLAYNQSKLYAMAVHRLSQNIK